MRTGGRRRTNALRILRTEKTRQTNYYTGDRPKFVSFFPTMTLPHRTDRSCWKKRDIASQHESGGQSRTNALRIAGWCWKKRDIASQHDRGGESRTNALRIAGWKMGAGTLKINPS